MGKSLGLDKKENGEIHASFILVGTRLLIFMILKDGTEATI